MLRFVNNIAGTYTGQLGTVEGQAYSNTTDFAILQFEESTSNENGVLFMAWNDPNSSVKMDCTVYRDGEPKVVYTDRDAIQPIAGNASNVTRADNGGALLGWANLWKDIFFGGETQTAATLYDWLCEKYGQHTYFYCSTISNAPGICNFDPDGWAGQITSSEISLDYGRAAEITFNPDLRMITFTGADYGTIVSSYPDASAQTYKSSYVCAAAVFDENVQPPTLNELKFDVYIDGTKDPNVAIKWSADVEDNFSLQLVTPMVWTKPEDTIYYNTREVSGYVVPNEQAPDMLRYSNNWAGSYAAPYLAEFGACAAPFNTITRAIYFGVDGIADQMYYLMRFNEQVIEGEQVSDKFGDLFIVTVPREVNSIEDITVERVLGSSMEVDFTSNIQVHIGAPDDDTPDDDEDYDGGDDYDGTDPGPYNPEEQKPDFTSYERTGFTGKAVLTKTYAITEQRLANVGSKLWSQSYFDVLKIQNNPIENIVGVKWFPFSLTGTDTEIKVGNVLFGVMGVPVDTLHEINIGSAKYQAKNPAKPTFLDMSPYTTLKLHLPMCGIVQLDATECLNRNIRVKYVVDLVAGDCIAYVFLDDGKIPYMQVAGSMGVDIPITSSNRVQTEIRAASTAISAVTGAAGHIMTHDYLGAASDAVQGGLSVAGMDFTTQRVSNHSSACASKENGAVFLEIWRPAFDVSEGFKQRHGWPCHKYVTLGTLAANGSTVKSGFVKCDSRTKIDFAVTSRENEMIEQLLCSGVYITQRDPSWTPIPD